MDPGDDHDLDEPTLITSHLAYFFVPLAEPLGLPDKYTLRVLEPTPPELLRHGVHPHSIGASLRFHHVMIPTAYTAGLMTVFDLAAQSLPQAEHGEEAETAVHKIGGAGDIAANTRATTVVEMAVALGLSDLEDAQSDHADAALSDRLTEAFDRGLEYIRQFQRACYLMRRVPIRLVTREALPFAVPFGVRRLFDEDDQPLPFQVPLSIYLLNMNTPATADVPWADGDDRMLDTAIAHQATDGPFASYLDLLRDADVALTKDGAYRSAVLFLATACEVLLDELLAHLMWEEGKRPEDAATVFDSLLTPRVKAHYHGRLGGRWRVDEKGPIGDWSVLVARLRNRVVHGGYEPTVEQASAALDATTALAEHLGDLVAGRARTYPRTALVLPGEEGLRRRHRWRRDLEALRNDPSEVTWRPTFARWRLAMQRARTDSPVAEPPSTAAASICVVTRTNGAVQWVAHDAEAGMAAVVDPDRVMGVSPEQRAATQESIACLTAQPGRSDVAILLSNVRAADIPADSWLPEYRLVPSRGVMVNGQDLDPALIA